MEVKNTKPHVVLFCSPGLGHQVPVLELGKRLVTHHNLDVTIFVVASRTSQAEAELLQSAMSQKISEMVELPTPDISKLIDRNAAVVTQLCVMMREVRPALRSALSGLKSRPSALIVDLFGSESLVIGKELGIPSYAYIGSNAWFLALTLYVPTLDKEVVGEYVAQKNTLKIPGCVPVRPEDVVDPMLDRTNQEYFEYLRMAAKIPTGDGILLNTWEDLEATTIEALRQLAKVPVYPVGPLTRLNGSIGSESKVFEWLDQQPNNSVVYVSFGSGGTLSFEQMAEVAWGLELSQQRFLWVVRPPNTRTGDGSFFTTGSGRDDVAGYLPDGFLTRTKNVGLVAPEWAPQVGVLAHQAVGGFFSHCGWNSTLESITNEVPMIAWPLYAEQRMNATLLAEELGIAVRSKVLPSKEVVKREEIAEMIKRIMVENEEAVEIRNKVKQLKRSAEKALSEGGSSYNALSIVAKECEMSSKLQEVKTSVQLSG